MHRLLVPSESLAQDLAVLPQDAVRHLKVLRPKPGEEIEREFELARNYKDAQA